MKTTIDARMLVFLVMLLTVLVTGDDKSLDERWERFKRDNQRNYATPEVEEYRRGLWEGKVRGIEQHNEEFERGDKTYSMKETQWDDLTFPEFKNRRKFDANFMPRLKRQNDNDEEGCFYEEAWNDTYPYGYTSTEELPDNVDWSQKGYVNSVRNQGSTCGSCWAFSAVGSIEGQWFKKTGDLVSLSPQFLVDCSTKNGGCKGGEETRAFQDVIAFEGISSEEQYPYTETEGSCQRETTSVAAHIDSYYTINTREELMNAVAYIGPISTGMKTGDAFPNYEKGVFDNCTGKVDHAVVVVGYGMLMGKKVWKIKNSHGSDWGDDGYMYIERDRNGDCGVYDYASFPTIDGVERGEPNEGEVHSLTGELGNVSGATDRQGSFLVAILSVYLSLLALKTIC